MAERVIRVTGKGMVSVPPDCIEVQMLIETVAWRYEEAMDLAAGALDEIRAALKKDGLEREDIRTSSFGVSTDYRQERDSAGNYKSVFYGFEVNNRLVVELPADTKRLGRVLSLISRCGASPHISLAFKLKDTTALSHTLLRRAFEDARAKASTLAQASGDTLGPVLSIDHSWSQIEVRRDIQYSDSVHASTSSAMLDIEPADLTAEETVTVAWSLV